MHYLLWSCSFSVVEGKAIFDESNERWWRQDTVQKIRVSVEYASSLTRLNTDADRIDKSLL